MCFKRIFKKLFNWDFSKEELCFIELLSKNKKLPTRNTSSTQFDVIQQSVFS